MTTSNSGTYSTFPLRRFITSITDGPFGSSLTSSHYSDEGARVIRLGNIGSSCFKEQDAAYIPLEYFKELRQHEVRSGDLLIAGLGDANNPVGRACIAPDLGHAIVKADCFRVRLDEERCTHGYAAWALNSSFVSDQVSTLTRGSTRARINLEVARDIHLPIPTVNDQHQIARFLDVETVHISKMISFREQQLALLTERETALILRSVAGRGEPGRNKPSDLAWLGKVPESWPVTTVSQHYEVLLGKMLNPERAKGDHLRPYLRNTNVQWDHITTDNLVEMNFPPEERVRYRVQPGDLLICEGGQPGRCAIWNESSREIYYQKALHRVRPRGHSSARWLFYCMKAATSQNVFAVEGNSTTIGHLTSEQLRAHRFPFPSESIQSRIVTQLDEWTTHKQACTTKINQQLTLLAERRQALITAAVTGQIDVSTASGRGVDVP